MKITVVYPQAPPRIIETSGESLLSADAVRGAPEWAGALHQPVVATHMRFRTDLACAGGPLVAEISCHTAGVCANPDKGEVRDFGSVLEVPALTTTVFRTWVVLTPQQLADAIEVNSDAFWLRRVNDRLLDLTCYRLFEKEFLSSNERNGQPFAHRIKKVHRCLQNCYSNKMWKIANGYNGLDGTLLAYANALDATKAEDAAPREAKQEAKPEARQEPKREAKPAVTSTKTQGAVQSWQTHKTNASFKDATPKRLQNF